MKYPELLGSSTGRPLKKKTPTIFVCLTPKTVGISSCWLNHPSEKYARQIGSFPQVLVKITKIFELPKTRFLQACKPKKVGKKHSNMSGEH